MYGRFFQCAFALALMVGCDSGKSPMAPVASSEVADPAAKLVISREKAGDGRRGRYDGMASATPVEKTPKMPDVAPPVPSAPQDAEVCVPVEENLTPPTIEVEGVWVDGGVSLALNVSFESKNHGLGDYSITVGSRVFTGNGAGRETLCISPPDTKFPRVAEVTPREVRLRACNTAGICADKVLVFDQPISPPEPVASPPPPPPPALPGPPVPSVQTPEPVPPPPVPASRPAGDIKIQKNTIYSDHTESNPSGVAGSKDVFLGSFVITAGAGGLSTNLITVADDVVSGALGQGFYNLGLYSGGPVEADPAYRAGIQIGQTVGTLSNSHDFYDFVPSPAITLDSGQKFRVNIYAAARASGNFDLINADQDGIIYPSAVVGIDRQTGEPVNGSMNIGLQRVFIAEHGSVDVTIGPYSAIEPPHTLKPSVWKKVLKVRVEAGRGENIVFSALALGIRMRDAEEGHLIYNTNGIGGFRLVSNGVVIGAGNAPSGFDGLRRLDLSGVITLYPNSPISVTAGSIWEGDVEIGINELAVLGHTIQLCLDTNLAKDAAFDLLPLIDARGVISSTRIIPTVFGHDEWFVVGPEFTVGE